MYALLSLHIIYRYKYFFYTYTLPVFSILAVELQLIWIKEGRQGTGHPSLGASFLKACKIVHYR